MFPLGMVLVPGVFLPLHVFEERYRELVHDVLDGDREFGVVLIERGSEVGGGDTRSSIGTIARIVQAEELPDGRWAVGAVGDRRIRVVEWLSDEPYPRAIVDDWPDESAVDADLRSCYETVVAALRTALGLAGELGRDVAPVDSPLPDDPTRGSFALVALAPLGPLDQQRLLCSPGPAHRLELLQSTLTEQITALRAELQMGIG